MKNESTAIAVREDYSARRAGYREGGRPAGPLSPEHRTIARYIALGFSDRAIGEKTGNHWRSIWRIRYAPGVQEHVEHLRELASAVASSHESQMDEILDRALDRMQELLDSPETPPRVLEKLIAQALDRHPSGAFVRQKKRQESARGGLSNGDIERLKHLLAGSDLPAMERAADP